MNETHEQRMTDFLAPENFPLKDKISIGLYRRLCGEDFDASEATLEQITAVTAQTIRMHHEALIQLAKKIDELEKNK
jgi:hypothetical protein